MAKTIPENQKALFDSRGKLFLTVFEKVLERRFDIEQSLKALKCALSNSTKWLLETFCELIVSIL